MVYSAERQPDLLGYSTSIELRVSPQNQELYQAEWRGTRGEGDTVPKALHDLADEIELETQDGA